MSDYYQILGVEKTASEDDIKKAYRKLAMKHHPDRGGDQAEFQKIQEAYSVLGDSQKRAEYDNPAPGGFHFHRGGVPPEFADIFGSFSDSDIFKAMFGQRRGQQARNRNLNLQTQITLEDAYSGKELIASIKMPNGKDQTIEVKIPPGIQDGTTLRLAGMGDDTHGNLPRGDLHLTIHIVPHHLFQRQGDDLIRNIEISCVDAMVGKSITIPTIEGKTLEVKIAAGTQPGQILAIQGHGMPFMSDPRFKGRMLLITQITVPKDLTDKQKDQLKEIFE